MQALINFLRKFGNLLLFLFLEIIAMILLIRFNDRRQAIFLSSANAVSGWIYARTSTITDYLSLNDQIADVQEHNKQLLESLPAFGRNNSSLDSIVIDSSDLVQTYHLIPARVINNSITSFDNYITLDKGKNHGVISGMGVIGSSGPIGVVQNASRHYSRVISLLHREMHIPAKLKSGYFGSINWDGGDIRFAKMLHVPKHADIEINDPVYSLEYSQIFPSDLLLGYVHDYSILRGSNFMDVTVRLKEDLGKVNQVFVVKNLEKPEIDSLEQTE